MPLCLRVIEDCHLVDISEALAHVAKEGLVDVVVEVDESNLLRQDGADVVLIKLFAHAYILTLKEVEPLQI